MTKLLLLILIITFANADVNNTHNIEKRVTAQGLYVYKDSNYGGASTFFSPPFSYNIPVGDTFYNSISSLKVLAGSISTFFTGPNYSGTCWTFAPGDYSNLASYGINDQTKSLSVTFNDFFPDGTVPLAVLYKDSNYVGKSIAVTTTTTFVPIDGPSTPINGCGHLESLSLSSLRIFPHTNITLVCTVSGTIYYTGYTNTGTSIVSLNAPFGLCPNDSVYSVNVQPI